MSFELVATKSTSLQAYFDSIKHFQPLDRDTETKLTQDYYETKNPESARKLVCANLRFVVYIAKQYRAANLHLLELIQEGNIGLMLAIKRFNPYKGVRLISYAVWWIKAKIQQCLIENYSIVKFGTTQTQKRLFFSYQKTKEKLLALTGTATDEDLAHELKISTTELQQISSRLTSTDASLDTPISEETFETRVTEIKSQTKSPEEAVISAETRTDLQAYVSLAFQQLTTREQQILAARFNDTPLTLRELAERFQVSRERIRQIEANAKLKVKKYFESQPEAQNLLKALNF